MFVFVADIKELGLALSVVRGYKLANDIWQVIFVGHFQSFRHVADDNLGTLDVGQHLMRVNTRLILRKVDRVREFADVVIQGTGTYQLGLGTDLVGYLASQIRHLDRVVEGAWCHLTHLSEHFVISVRQFNECDITCESEGLFNEIEQRIAEEHGDAVDCEIVVG